MVLWLDWEKIAAKGLSKEQYIDEYIQAEIPIVPPKTDGTKPAVLQRYYKRLVENTMYHTCADWCRMDNGRCDKRFPVKDIINNNA
jgi:hypothetical protein